MKFPSVTPDDISNEIRHIHFFTAADGIERHHQSRTIEAIGRGDAAPEIDPIPPAGRVTTFCMLTLQNGYTVFGHSACADPRNFDAELGRNYAFDDAKKKVWPLLGFRLRDELSKTEQKADDHGETHDNAAE